MEQLGGLPERGGISSGWDFNSDENNRCSVMGNDMMGGGVKSNWRK